SVGRATLEPGQFDAASAIDTRFFKAAATHKAIGASISSIDNALGDAAIEAIVREGKALELSDDEKIVTNDVVALTGTVAALDEAVGHFGEEIPRPSDLQLIEERRKIILTNAKLAERELHELHTELNADARRGVFLTGVSRSGHDLPLLPSLKLHQGDLLEVTGRPKDLNRVQPQVGYKISAAAVTDFIFFGIGMAIGLLIGLVSFKIGGVPVSVGSGGGCLLSGLFFGWLRSTHPRFAALPQGASNFLRDFGLAVFVGLVGISAGPHVVSSVQQYGLMLFFLGVGVTIIPQIFTFFFTYYVLRIKNPIELLACVVGGRSANPGFAALLDKAGNATPVVAFTVTYAVANVLLTLWGPIIVGIITKNPSP
ncbi:MAG: aspartate-alanine antiporter, partial [Hyphomicrobiales bacterium]